MSEDAEKLVIVGSGPAGLTAAVYAARSFFNPLVIEGNDPGGLLMGTSYVENWPGETSILGPELMRKMREHAAHFNARFLSEEVMQLIRVTALLCSPPLRKPSLKQLPLLLPLELLQSD